MKHSVLLISLSPVDGLMMSSGLAESVVAAAFSRVGQKVLHVDRSVLILHLRLTCVTSS